jgi:hypothetical protein
MSGLMQTAQRQNFRRLRYNDNYSGENATLMSKDDLGLLRQTPNVQ